MRISYLVPLPQQALIILEKIKRMGENLKLFFIGDHEPRKPMSENAVNKALKMKQHYLSKR
jgi:hypothetical protein